MACMSLPRHVPTLDHSYPAPLPLYVSWLAQSTGNSPPNASQVGLSPRGETSARKWPVSSHGHLEAKPTYAGLSVGLGCVPGSVQPDGMSAAALRSRPAFDDCRVFSGPKHADPSVGSVVNYHRSLASNRDGKLTIPLEQTAMPLASPLRAVLKPIRLFSDDTVLHPAAPRGAHLVPRGRARSSRRALRRGPDARPHGTYSSPRTGETHPTAHALSMPAIAEERRGRTIKIAEEHAAAQIAAQLSFAAFQQHQRDVHKTERAAAKTLRPSSLAVLPRTPEPDTPRHLSLSSPRSAPITARLESLATPRRGPSGDLLEPFSPRSASFSPGVPRFNTLKGTYEVCDADGRIVNDERNLELCTDKRYLASTLTSESDWE